MWQLYILALCRGEFGFCSFRKYGVAGSSEDIRAIWSFSRLSGAGLENLHFEVLFSEFSVLEPLTV